MTLAPMHSTTAGLGDRIASFSGRLDAEHERLKAELGRDSWRYALLAAVATVAVFVGGVAGFLHETRYRGPNMGRRPAAALPVRAPAMVSHEPVMVIVDPR